MPKRLLVCGDRNWTDANPIQFLLVTINPTIVIEGEAKGADTIARVQAERLNIPVLKFPAQWNTYGKAAGVIRNQQMLDEGKPEMVVGFHSEINSSKGTKDMLLRALRANLIVWLYDGGWVKLDQNFLL